MEIKKYKTLSFAVLATATMVATGCASHRAGKRITVEPGEKVLTLDSTRSAGLDVTFHVPEHYFSKRSRLFISPALYSGDSLIEEYPQVVLDAPIFTKKTERAAKLENKVDTVASYSRKVDNGEAQTIPYRQTVVLPEGVESGEVIAKVSTDGCGVCSGIDTLHLAGLTNPVSLIDVKESLKLDWIEPEFKIKPKIRSGQGVARLQFIINRYDIRTDLGRNKAELDTMLAKLGPILADTLATLEYVKITGVASADGSLRINTPLSRNRANSAMKWLVQQLDIPAELQKRFSISSRPEGWGLVLEAMRAAGDPDTTAVAAILDKYADYNDDVQEYYIRRLDCWKRIRDNYLQKDRNVEYLYSYQIRSFTTDEELLEMYDRRPDAFSEDELLRVSTLKQTPEEKKEVYRTILHYFPQSRVAANNLAVLLLREGKEDEAREVFDSVEGYSEETLKTRAALYVYRNEYEKAVELLETEVDDPEARYNLGLVKAQLRQFDEAYELLAPFGDINSAVVALSVDKNDEADRMLRAIDFRTPQCEYVRAITAARLGRDTEALEHIARAAEDAVLRERAKTEYDFKPYRDNLDFRTAIYK